MGAELSLSIWCVCVPVYRRWTIRISPFPTNRWEESSGRTRTCSAKLNTDLSGPAAVVLCPQCLQWIFVYSPNISPAPCPPCQTEIRVPLPSHSVSQVPLSQSQTTPRCTCRSCTLEKRPPPSWLQSLMSFLFPFIKSIKIIPNETP